MHLCSAAGIIGNQGETATSFLATLASSSTEEMEAELQERLDSSQKQVTRVVELYEGLKSTVERLKVEPDSGGGKTKGRAWVEPGLNLDVPVGSVCICMLA